VTEPIAEDRIAAKEAELAGARAAMVANFDRPVGGSSRRKSFGRRVDAQIRRGAALAGKVRRLESEIAALQRKQDVPELPPVTVDALRSARFIRTDVGWYEVVKVNRVTVKVKVKPGWDDLIKISKILETR
jgi:hypothetical protein